eukprot:IDg19275t1
MFPGARSKRRAFQAACARAHIRVQALFRRARRIARVTARVSSVSRDRRAGARYTAPHRRAWHRTVRHRTVLYCTVQGSLILVHVIAGSWRLDTCDLRGTAAINTSHGCAHARIGRVRRAAPRRANIYSAGYAAISRDHTTCFTFTNKD